MQPSAILSRAALETVLVLAALGQFVSLPALKVAAREGIINLGAEFQKMDPLAKRVAWVLLVTIQGVIYGTGALVILARREIAAGGRLAQGFAALMSLLWFWRMFVQIRDYGPLLGASVRHLHRLLVLLFAFLTLAYATVAVAAGG
jgi:hypothetical protein